MPVLTMAQRCRLSKTRKVRGERPEAISGPEHEVAKHVVRARKAMSLSGNLLANRLPGGSDFVGKVGYVLSHEVRLRQTVNGERYLNVQKNPLGQGAYEDRYRF
jgi:hypothetical protein